MNKEPLTTRRRSSRRSFVSFVWYKVIDEGATEGSEGEGIAQACDVSRHGVGFYVSHALPIGSQVFLELATRAGYLSLVGRIRHCTEKRPGYYRVGLSLDIMPPNHRATFIKMLGKADDVG